MFCLSNEMMGDADIVFLTKILYVFGNPLKSPFLLDQCRVAQDALSHAVLYLISYQLCEVVRILCVL